MQNYKWKKYWAILLLCLFCVGEISRIPLYATTPLGGGPGTPEVQSFKAANITELVNPFTGDFSYNIPLMDVGGYPINLSYQSGISPEQEATWVGLGWNLNVGSINRNVRGLPDDFKGDKIKKQQYIAPDYTIGTTMAFSGELVGAEFLKGLVQLTGAQTLGFQYNNYKGWDYTVGSSNGIKSSLSNGDGAVSADLSLSSGYSRSSGNYLRPNVGLGWKMQNGENSNAFGVNLGMDASSREGIKAISFGLSYSRNWVNSERGHTTKMNQYSNGVNFPLLSAKPSYIPSYNMPRSNLSGTFGLKAGGEISFVTLAGEVSGYFSLQKIKENIMEKASFGYLYAEDGANDSHALMDVNREKDGAFREKMPFLPIPSFTNDVYFVTGQGFQGQFRPFRSDIGILTDPNVSNEGYGVTAGVDASFGATVKAGVDVAALLNNGGSGRWEQAKAALAGFSFFGKDKETPLYEPVYFKQVGEMSSMTNSQLFNDLGGFKPFNFAINKHTITADIQVLDEEGSRDVSTLTAKRLNRAHRADHLSFLTVEEAMQVGLTKGLSTTEGLTYQGFYHDINKKSFARDSNFRAPHHISEMALTRKDGNRYIYGLPAYNISKKEVSFNAAGDTPTEGLITYEPDVDDSKENKNGIDNFFSQTETPAYAYAYHLTAVLSPDYVDLNGDGPSPDDLGTYTRFHYNRPVDNFGWRMPAGLNKAKFSEGHLATDEDDRGHYVAGEKEVYNLKIVETKNFIAEFYTSDRSDGQEILETGAAGGQHLHKLDSIKLFARPDAVVNGSIGATPLKTVFFEYGYDLCDGAPGAATGGKLTLKEVYFTYGNSNLKRYSRFKFDYNENNEASNPDYHPQSSDRWGSYKKPNVLLPNDDYPYVTKTKLAADSVAKAWNLTMITTPNKSKIAIEYEADDYAFVQDRQAMDMRSILGFSSGVANNLADVVDRLYQGDTPNRYLYFKMKENESFDADIIKYLEGIEELYFRSKIEVDVGIYEDITGFIPIEVSDADNYGISPFDNTVGWIKLPRFKADGKDEATDDGTIHPFTKASAQMIAQQLPKIAYGLNEVNAQDFLDFSAAVVKNAAGPLANVASFENFIEEYVGDSRGRQVDLTKSFVRLNNPDGFKYGGGSRVKRLTINDSWEEMTEIANSDYTYGQEYFYEKTGIINGQATTISSGVAAYEPLIGGDENPFVEPAKYHIDKKLATDVNAFAILPVNEAYFPAPNVGYSKVLVRNIKPAGIERTATGWSTHEYYTAKDFPTKVQLTTLRQYQTKPFPNPFIHKSGATTSQGYAIELNNMHGQMKSQLVYAETDSLNPISGIRHFFKTDPSDAKRLANKVAVLNPETGNITDKIIGVDYEIVLDARKSINTGTEAGGQFNLDLMIPCAFPVFTISGYPQISRTNIMYQSIVANKIIMRAGILDRIEAFDRGASLMTKNMLYDETTGNVVVSAVENQFGDFNYTTNIPAHWMYAEMGKAYENQGMLLDTQMILNGNLMINNAADYFKKGDELALFQIDEVETIEVSPAPTVPVTRTKQAAKAWVLEVGSNSIKMIDANGQRVSDTASVKVIRSGNRNHLEQIAGVVITRQNPINPTTSATFDFEQVLDASSQVFDAHWQSYLGFHIDIPISSCSCSEKTVNQGIPITQHLTDFVTTTVLGNPENSARILPVAFSSLLPDFNQASTNYQLTNYGSLVELVFSDSLSNETCRLTIETKDGSNVPFYSLENPVIELIYDNEFACSGTNKMKVLVSTFVGNTPVTIPLIIQADCIELLNCRESNLEFGELVCGLESGAVVNPFTSGIYGNWRPKANYKFITQRENTIALKESGFFDDFHSFFTGNVSEGPAPINGVSFSPNSSSSNGNWQRENESQIIDPFGKELESLDALNIPTASVYGYSFQLPTAVAQNAYHQDIAFDGFEDYDFRNLADSPFDDCTLPTHWKLTSNTPVNPTAAIAREETISHSGYYSLRLDGEIAIEREIFSRCDPATRSTPNGNSYQIQDCDLIRNFAPSPGKYWLSAWVKEATDVRELDTLFEKSSINVNIQIGGTSLEESFVATGQLIDGWQQINGIFTIPDDPNLTRITIQLANPEGDDWVTYFDDIRIQPYNAIMNAYVYDPVSLRLLATLDDRNFGTFYEYDNEGNLARTEKETEAGRLTLQEIRSSIPTEVEEE